MAMTDKAYSADQLAAWSSQGADYERVAQETPEMAAVRQKMYAQTQQPSQTAEIYRQLEQEKLQRQAARAAYAGGYNPAAQTQALEAVSEAQGDVYARARQIESEDADRAMKNYAQILQQRQKMAMAAQEAKAAYIMGNQKLAIQNMDSMRRAEVAAKGVQMQEAAAKADATARFTTAVVSAGGALLAQKYAGAQNPTANAPTPTAVQGAAPSLYQQGGLLYQAPVATQANYVMAPKV